MRLQGNVVRLGVVALLGVVVLAAILLMRAGPTTPGVGGVAPPGTTSAAPAPAGSPAGNPFAGTKGFIDPDLERPPSGRCLAQYPPGGRRAARPDRQPAPGRLVR